MPQDSLFRFILELLSSLAGPVADGVAQSSWRIALSVLTAVMVVGVIWMACEPSWLRTTFMIVAGVGIPIEGIRWHMRSGD